MVAMLRKVLLIFLRNVLPASLGAILGFVIAAVVFVVFGAMFYLLDSFNGFLDTLFGK